MSLKSFSRKALVPLALTAMVSVVYAQAAAPALPDPASTSVQAMGWMQGFPPAADKLITFDNPLGNTFPRNVISPVMARLLRTFRCVKADVSAVRMVMPADGPSLGVAPSGTWMWMSHCSNTR